MNFNAQLNGKELPIHQARVSAYLLNRVWPGKQRSLDQTEFTEFLSFDLEARNVLDVRFDAPEEKKIEIRPLSAKFPVERIPQGIRLVVDAPCQFTIEVGDRHHVLHVFANPPFEEPHVPEEIHFGPGEHHPGVLVPKSGQTIRIDEGAVVYGAVSGLAGEKISDLMMRFAEFVMSIPSILLIIFFQAIWGKATVFSLSVIIACVSWMNISKIVRSEVRQIRQSDYVLAAGIMEGGFWYIFRRHLLPNFVSSIMFMVVTNIGQAMITESTLSFLGLGLPLTTVSWGSLMSLSQEALLSGYWWIIVIPGFVLVTTLACVTDLGESVRRRNNRLYSNL